MLHFAGFFTWQQILQFSSVNASLQRFTLALMTTQHNPTVPRRSNPLQVYLTARILPLRHSQNLTNSTILFFVTRTIFHSSTRTTISSKFSLHTLLFLLRSHHSTSIGFTSLSTVKMVRHASSACCSIFLTAILVRYACTQDGTPACFPRLHSFVARFLAVARLRNQLSRVPFVYGTTPRPNAFAVRLSHGLGMQLRVGQQAADNRSSGSVRRTGAIVAKRRSVRFTCSTSKGPGVRHAIHRQE